jgi:hypothetical protein
LVWHATHGQYGDPVGHGGRVVVAKLEHRVLHQAEGEDILIAGMEELKCRENYFFSSKQSVHFENNNSV